MSPEERYIVQFILTDGKYAAKRLTEGSLESSRLSGFTLDVTALFATLEGLADETFEA